MSLIRAKSSNLLSTSGGPITKSMWDIVDGDKDGRDEFIAFCEIGKNYFMKLKDLPIIRLNDVIVIYKIIRENVIDCIAKLILPQLILSPFEEVVFSTIKVDIKYQINKLGKNKEIFYQNKKITLLDRKLSSLYLLIKDLKGLPKTYDYILYYNGYVLTDEHLESMNNNNREIPMINLVLGDIKSIKKSKEGEKIKVDNTLNSIISGFKKITFPKYNSLSSKCINFSIANVDQRILIFTYLLYWGLNIINSKKVCIYQLIDCVISLQRCVSKYSDILSTNMQLDCDYIIDYLFKIYDPTSESKSDIITNMMINISTDYPSLINSSTFDISTKKGGIQLYREQDEVISIINDELTKEVNLKESSPTTPSTKAFHELTISPALLWYKVPPSGGKTILSITLSAMISEYYSKPDLLNKKVLYICYNTFVRLSVANAAKLAGMPFWVVSTNGDLNTNIDIPYIGRKNGRHTHILKYEDYTLTNKYIEYEKNKDILPAEIIIADIESGLELIRNFPTKFVVYLDEPTAGAENGIDDNKIQRLNAKIIKSAVNTQLVMLSSTLPNLDDMESIKLLYPNRHIIESNRIPVGCRIIDPVGNEILPIELAENIEQFRIIIANIDSKYTKYYTFDMAVIISRAVENIECHVQISEILLFNNYFNNIGKLSSKLIQDYIIDVFAFLLELNDEHLIQYMTSIFTELSNNRKTHSIKNIVKEGKVLLVGFRENLDSCISRILNECEIENHKLGEKLIAKLKEFDYNNAEYKKNVIRYEKASKSEKDMLEEPIAPEFIWGDKIGNSCVSLSNEEFNLLPNETAALLLSGCGIYDPVFRTPLENNISMREVINGNLAALFSTPDITYGTNMPLISVYIDSSYGNYATPNSLYQLIGRTGRTGRAHKSNVLFEDVLTMKKAVLPSELIDWGSNDPIDDKFEAFVIEYHLNI
jgi:hypothetical protein